MSELTKAMLAFDELIGNRVPDRPLDPPDIPDATDEEIRERRRDALFYIPSEDLVDMLCDDPLLGPTLYTTLVHPLRYDRQPDEYDKSYLADRIVKMMLPKIERWLDANDL